MALIFIGQTICPICSKTINEGEELYGFPAFVSNVKDPLYFYNDAAFHTTCLAGTEDGRNAMQFTNEVYENRSLPIKCHVTGNEITDPEACLGTGYLSPDKNSPLYAFNFLTIDKKNLPAWEKRSLLIELLEKLKTSGNWQDVPGYDYLGKLIKDLSI